MRDKAFFGEGQGGIFLERLDCTGNESGLKQCSLLNTQCIHSEDVGVICQSNGENKCCNPNCYGTSF